MSEPFEILYLQVRVKKYKFAFKRKYHREATIDDLKKCIENDDCPSDSCACASGYIDSTSEKNCSDNGHLTMNSATMDSKPHQFGCAWCWVFTLLCIIVVYKWPF